MGRQGIFGEKFLESQAFMHHAVDDAPIGQATQIAVINEQVGLEFAGIRLVPG